MSYFSDQAGGGVAAASLKLAAPGASFSGTIESIAEVDKKKYNQGMPSQEYELDAAGNRKRQLRVIIQGRPDGWASTGKPLLDETTGQQMVDDGRRALYAAKGTNVSFRIADALLELGQHVLEKGLEVGGQFAIRRVADLPTPNGAAHQHEVKYAPPAPSSGAFFDGQQQAPVQQQAPQQPQYAQPAPPQAPQQPQYAPPAQQPQYAQPAAPQAGMDFSQFQQPAPPQQPQAAPPVQQQAPAPQQAAPATWGQGEPPF